MSKSAVYLIPCENYNTETVYQSLKTGLELMGGITACISPEESVLLKPNLLKGADPEKNITTHPAVLEAVIRCLQDEQFKNVKCGDGCGIGSGKTSKAMETAGMKSVLDKYGIELCEFDEGVTVNFPEGSAAKKFNLCKEVTEADALISICKMKTHALETISGALKNQYGCLTMKDKGVGHAKYPDAVSFANMVADLNACIKPRLYIMDGIVAMEGNGPSSGDPRQMNLLLISTDPVAMDTVFSRLIYLKPELVPTTVSGARAGLGTMSESEISVITPVGELTASEAAEKYGCPEFVVSRKGHRFWKVGELLGIKKVKRDRPVLIPDLCTGCGKCHEACPADEKAVQSGNGQKAVFDYSKCIRCYCCQELCPFKAIEKRIGRQTVHPMKACKFILPILLAFLLLTGCSGENTPIRPVSLSEIQNGDAVWCRTNGKIYYSNGGKVFSCNAAGKDTEFVCKLPRKLRKNFVAISAATADNLIIQCGKRACNYYSLNIQTGESVLLFENILYNSLQVLCSCDSTLFSLQKPQKANYDPILINTVREEETVYVLSTNIDTAESELLGHISINGGISNADGAVSEGRLFFACKPATGMYSIPLTGEDVEFILPDTEAIPEMDEVVSLEEKDGVLYILMWSGETNPKSALCTYDLKTNKVLPIVTTDNTFTAKDFLIDGNTYYLFNEFSSVSGKL